MGYHHFNQNKSQFDYFSPDYRCFEEDFYRYSALEIPLTFLTDDILLTMSKSQKRYFKLNKENALDRKDHYFLFNPTASSDNPNVIVYQYLSSSESIPDTKSS